MPNVKIGQHYAVRKPRGVGPSTFTVIAVDSEKATVQSCYGLRKIKLSTFETHRFQYILLKDAK